MTCFSSYSKISNSTSKVVNVVSNNALPDSDPFLISKEYVVLGAKLVNSNI